VITFIGIWLIRDAVGFLMGIVFGLGLFGVWIGWIADFALRALLVYLRFRAGKWKTLRV
jgi:Na+-driven multidrug efflux pump